MLVPVKKKPCFHKRVAYPPHMDSQNDMALLAAVAKMIKARFSIRQIAAALDISLAEAMELICKAGQLS